MKKRINITLDEEINKRIPIYARDVKHTKSSLIEHLLKEYMDKLNPEKLIEEIQVKIDLLKEKHDKEIKDLEEEKDKLIKRLPYYKEFKNMDEEALTSWAIGQAKRIKYNKNMSENVRRTCKTASIIWHRTPDELWQRVNELVDKVEPTDREIEHFSKEAIFITQKTSK